MLPTGMGLVSKVVNKGEAREAAEAIARLIAGHPQLCMLNDRRSLYASESLDFDTAMRYDRHIHS